MGGTQTFFLWLFAYSENVAMKINLGKKYFSGKSKFLGEEWKGHLQNFSFILNSFYFHSNVMLSISTGCHYEYSETLT